MTSSGGGGASLPGREHLVCCESSGRGSCASVFRVLSPLSRAHEPLQWASEAVGDQDRSARTDTVTAPASHQEQRSGR